jgi:hypothetical protein
VAEEGAPRAATAPWRTGAVGSRECRRAVCCASQQTSRYGSRFVRCSGRLGQRKNTSRDTFRSFDERDPVVLKCLRSQLPNFCAELNENRTIDQLHMEPEDKMETSSLMDRSPKALHVSCATRATQGRHEWIRRQKTRHSSTGRCRYS